MAGERPMSYRHAAEREAEPEPAVPKRCWLWHRWELVQSSYPITASRCVDCGVPRVMYSIIGSLDRRLALDSPHIPAHLLKLLTAERVPR